ncbi:MAG: hypothetical protein V4739_16315 [Pseudomonadota bacterium]
MSRHAFLSLGAALVLCASLTACGGSVDDSAGASPEVATEVPDSALTSATAFVQYLIGLLESPTSETSEPLSLDKIGEAPSSETDDVIVLN